MKPAKLQDHFLQVDAGTVPTVWDEEVGQGASEAAETAVG